MAIPPRLLARAPGDTNPATTDSVFRSAQESPCRASPTIRPALSYSSPGGRAIHASSPYQSHDAATGFAHPSKHSHHKAHAWPSVGFESAATHESGIPQRKAFPLLLPALTAGSSSLLRDLACRGVNCDRLLAHQSKRFTIHSLILAGRRRLFVITLHMLTMVPRTPPTFIASQPCAVGRADRVIPSIPRLCHRTTPL